MTLDELEAQCLKSKGMGCSVVTLVVPRRTPPKDDFIRVKGMGRGYVLNAQQTSTGWAVCAHFNPDTILKTIAKQRRLENTPDGTK